MTVFRARRVGFGRCRPCAGPGLRRQPRRLGATPLPLRRRRRIQTRYRWQPRRLGATPLPPSLPRDPAWERACAAATAPRSTSRTFSTLTLRKSRAPGHGRRARLAEADMASSGRAARLDGPLLPPLRPGWPTRFVCAARAGDGVHSAALPALRVAGTCCRSSYLQRPAPPKMGAVCPQVAMRIGYVLAVPRPESAAVGRRLRAALDHRR